MNDTDYMKTLHGLHVRTRTCINTDRGDIHAFYVQLELNLSPDPTSPDNWVDVARFDHQPERNLGHDIRIEGLHMDLCHPSENNRKITDFPHVDIDDAPQFCERYFEKNYRSICKQYAEWKGLTHWNWVKSPTR